MDFSRINLIFYTLKFLKPIQIYFRIYYVIRNKFVKKNYNINFVNSFCRINWECTISHNNSYSVDDNTFTFLNIKQEFSKEIDWNFNKHGKLWLYNLNYFDFLNQGNMKSESGIRLILDYVKKDCTLKDGKEPYPISLRGINWIKFLSKNKIDNSLINKTLYSHYMILINNLEYHLLGNHLLENSFSLLFGSYYFQNEKMYRKAKNLLIIELNEQIVEDGAHFELSPMYHQIILFRILDCIKLIKLNKWKNDDLISFLEKISSKMLSWLKHITFNNGDIPMVNDCAFGISPNTIKLSNYGSQLKIKNKSFKLSDSGYRFIKKKNYQLFIDVADVLASYQPGHVHSDTFNFILHAYNKPLIIDRATSTYEKNITRQLERKTSSHNTVSVGNLDQTQVWGGFRVAKRAKIISLEENQGRISSSHDGYKSLGIIHNRTFIYEDESIKIIDHVNQKKQINCLAHFHFHPTIKDIIIDGKKVFFKNHKAKILFNGKILDIKKQKYQYASGFNKTEDGIKIKVLFDSKLITRIIL